MLPEREHSRTNNSEANAGVSESRNGRFLILGSGILIFLIAPGYYGMSWVDNLDPFWFLIAMVLLPVIGAPVSLFYVAAGGGFPPLTGILLGCVGLVGSTAIGYLVGRWAVSESVRDRLLARIPQIDHLSELHCVRATILIRAVPGVPFWLQNLTLGAARVPFVSYILLSVSIQSTFLIATVLSLRGLLETDSRYLILGLAALLIAVYLSRFFLKKAKKKEVRTTKKTARIN